MIVGGCVFEFRIVTTIIPFNRGDLRDTRMLIQFPLLLLSTSELQHCRQGVYEWIVSQSFRGCNDLKGLILECRDI